MAGLLGGTGQVGTGETNCICKSPLVIQEPTERRRSRERGTDGRMRKKRNKKHVKEVLFLYLRDDRTLPGLLDVAFCRECVLSCYLYWIN